jgi:hypothetical protein|tara:strand:+ start:181 stop:462 length:282 start_codon:yes stop_codon:yes gene_type:complete
MTEILQLIAEVGFPIAAALAGGYFVFLTMRFILDGVMGSVKGLTGIINALDNRVKTMNHDVIRIDTLMSNAFGVTPDLNRIARADGKNDARRD